MTLLGGSRDPDEVQASVDQWVQGFADKARRYRDAQQRTEELRLTAASANGAVRVTVGADGNVTELELGKKARTMPLEELSAEILTTMRRAQSGIATRVGEVMTEQLGDEDLETRSAVLDNLRSRFPVQDAEEPPADQQPPAQPPAPPSPASPPVPPPAQPPGPPPPAPWRNPRPGPDDDDEDNAPW